MPPRRPAPETPDPEIIATARRLYREGARIPDILARTGFSHAKLYFWLRGGPPGARGRDGEPLSALPLRREVLGQRRRPFRNSRGSLVNRLWRAAERQAAEIEARLAAHDGPGRDRERDARTLAVLARTVRELMAIDAR